MNYRSMVSGALLIMMVAAGLVACSSDSTSPPTTKGPAFSAPLPIEIGHTIGAQTYPAGDSSAGGQGQTVGGVDCDTLPPIQHTHQHLTLIANGVQRAIPLGVGTKDPFIIQNFVIAARCFYWLHTHDASGILHVEAPVTTQFTLGQFFAIWGQPLSRTNVGGFSGTVTAYVDSTKFDGDLNALGLVEHQQITLIVGTVPDTIPIYAFPSAY
jgi:hypothetical protein